MKLKEWITKYKTDHEWRNNLSATISFVTSVAFLAYNLILGIIHKLIWHFSISIYYLVLVVLKAIILGCENKWKNLPSGQKEGKRLSLFKVESWLFILIDVAMIVPITMMVFSQRRVNVGMIPAIATAAYTTYQITMAIIGFNKSRNKDNWSLVSFKIISLKSAMVALLTLQNTLIMVFSQDASSMLPLTAVTSGAMFLAMIAISVLSLIKAKRQGKNHPVDN